MSSLRSQYQHARYPGPGGSLASSPPTTAYHDDARRNNPSPRARRLTGYGSSPPNQRLLLYEPDPRTYALPNNDVSGLSHGHPAGSCSYFCGWDSLHFGAHSHNTHTENALLVGSEGCLDTYIVADTKLIHYARLEDLPGAVLDARVVPNLGDQSLAKTQKVWPLVALTIHGPLIHPDEPHEPIRYAGTEERIKSYQTSVELYSLQTAEHIGTLFRTKPVDLEEPFGSKRFVPPPPQGDLRIEVRGQYIVVASGISGEVFIFGHDHRVHSGSGVKYRCLAKLWTAIQTPRPSSVSGEPNSSTGHNAKPILSLSFRWLALVPPSSASSINGEVPLVSEEHSRPPGLNTFMAPDRPPEDCLIDAPDVDTLLDRASKYVVKNSRALGEKGKEAWNNYWSSSQQRPDLSSPNYHFDTGHAPADYFPPTHGIGNTHSAPNRDPTLVAIYDLDRLLEHADGEVHHQPTKPLATFPAPLGCSFLSFSPDGRYLMTVSDKGEYQFVWHCFSVASTEASWTPKPEYDGVLKEVARFSRNTEASIIDVSWKLPYGEVIAILTAKGTIHVHALPPEATAWPLKPRAQGAKIAPEADTDLDRTHGDWATTAVSSARTAFGTLSSAARRRSSGDSPSGPPASLYSTIGSTIGSVASSGSRFVTKGVTSGYGFASDKLTYMRHAGDNKIYLPPSNLVSPAPRRIRFFDGTHAGSIGVIEEGRFIVYSYKIEKITSSRKGVLSQNFVTVDTRGSLRVNIPSIPDTLYPPVFAAALDSNVEAGSAGLQLDEAVFEDDHAEPRRSLAPPKATLHQAARTSETRHHEHRPEEWRAAAEMTSIAKKMPLYRHPRIRFFVHEEGSSADVGPASEQQEEEDFGLDGMEEGEQRWVFGRDLGRKKKVKVGRIAAGVEDRQDKKEGEEEDWEEVR